MAKNIDCTIWSLKKFCHIATLRIVIIDVNNSFGKATQLAR